MEDWEEDSESCRSSVISDLDELEANLYSIVHHEVNKVVDETLHEHCVIPITPIGKGFLRIPENVLNITEQIITNSKNVESAEEKEKSGRQEGGEVKDHSNVKLDHSKKCEQDLSNEYTDSRYNVGCANANENIIPTSVTAEADSGLSIQPNRACSSPVVIDVVSSADEDPDVHPVNDDSLKKTQSIEEVVVIDDSDSDIRIELEKVNVERKKRKKKRFSEVSDDIKLNMVKSVKANQFDKICKSHSPELDNFPVSPIIPNGTSTPKRNELNLSLLCKNWTPQMIHFYEDSWGGENLTLNQLLSPMSDHGWHLDISDEFSALPGRGQDRRYFGNPKTWCTNCNRRGHFKNECPEEIRTPHCRRCGSPDHTEYRCNHKLCLTCGNKTKVLVKACHSCRSNIDKGSICSVCSLRGHPSNCCPDLWRRFHATVVPGKIVCPKKVLYKNSMNMYCCNCASKGHHVYQCKKKTYSDYLPCSPKVIRYDDPSLQVKEIDPSFFSENWEKIGRVVSESRIEETPKRRKAENGQKGIKRSRTPDENKNSKIIKLSKTKAPSKETKTSTASVSAKLDPPKQKKKTKKPKKTKAKKLQNQPKTNQEAGKILSKKQPIVRDKIPPSTGSHATKDNNKYNNSLSNYLDQFPRRKSDKKIVLTKKEYQMLTTKQGEEVLKYVTREVKGSALTLLHGEVKILMFIGGKKSTSQAKNLMRSIIDDKDAWNSIAGSVTKNGTLSKIGSNKEKPSKMEVASTSDTRNDLRVEIKDQSSHNVRNVTCLPNSRPNRVQGPNKSKDVIKGKDKKNNESPGIEMHFDIKTQGPKSTIQSVARGLLRKEEFTPEKLKLFSSWALSNFGDAINGFIRYNLKALAKVNENGKPLGHFRKNLLTILKWPRRYKPKST